MNIENSPNITAVIATKDRGDCVCNALKHIYANRYNNFKVIVVDQSTDDLTKLSVSQYLEKPDFTYIRSESVGSSAGRNLAIQNADTELIAITDDDCEVSTDWLGDIIGAFEGDENVGVVYGRVKPGKSLLNNQFVTTFEHKNSYTLKTICDEHSLKGLCANMGIKKSVWQKLNGFDPMLGAGVHFNSCEETDMNIRALLNGFYVHYSPDISVEHHGYRETNEAQKLIEGYAYGNGALFAKHIKSGNIAMIYVIIRQIFNWAFGKSWVMSDASIKSSKLGRMKAFLNGLIKGFGTPVDRSNGHFKTTCTKQF